ncbi:MAG: electron transport complex subunit E [Desulfobacula sp.]|jgi:electron transport complex protein RnfE|uniref:electron transport complex subunit RsxE n=1 Tax=Desulfobacula sp. TaxID=2593537 RepID=UPI001D8F7907|nr:electron transport complex subunit E [Desulfobacula sp.]MBT3487072.1 electron transport complex subunit E [Desulfobacula sp.]MBT3806832.1 electron transport complex subunit E [Desulfobacula sp.]MBT4026775.1 electron transport complex subunit E [Desulfobacula sp.]MBT4199038.1 electron transport complex subunit E [Desulfobacula sp.]
MAQSLAKEFTKGLWAEIPPFRLVLGLCPVLAVTKTVENGIGMGVATTFVLVFANLLISLLRNVIPSKVRIACYIVIIATFVTIVELVMQAYTYELFLKLGIFIPLIVVNCIVLGRAEAFASKNGPALSVADGLGIGIGFTLSLAALGAVREILGAGTITIWGGNPVFEMGPAFHPFAFMVEAPGAFVALGLMLAIMNLIGSK